MSTATRCWIKPFTTLPLCPHAAFRPVFSPSAPPTSGPIPRFSTHRELRGPACAPMRPSKPLAEKPINMRPSNKQDEPDADQPIWLASLDSVVAALVILNVGVK